MSFYMLDCYMLKSENHLVPNNSLRPATPRARIEISMHTRIRRAYYIIAILSVANVLAIYFLVKTL